MDYGLSGRTALVMSSTRGLGLACACALAQEGVRVVINGRDTEAGRNALEHLPGDAKFFAADITDTDQRVRLVDDARTHLGAISIVVTNSSGPAAKAFQETSAADWKNSFSLVVQPAIDVVQRCVPDMVSEGWGRVVSLSSISGKEISLLGSQPNALRPALIGAFGTLAREIAPQGITVNSILSGPIDTPALRSVVRQHSGRMDLSEEEAIGVYAEAGPMRRIGRARSNGHPVGKHLFSDSVSTVPKIQPESAQNRTEIHVVLLHYTDTTETRFSAHAHWLYARLFGFGSADH